MRAHGALVLVCMQVFKARLDGVHDVAVGHLPGASREKMSWVQLTARIACIGLVSSMRVNIIIPSQG